MAFIDQGEFEAMKTPMGRSESRYVQTSSREKNYGFIPNLDFNPLPTRFNFTEFLPPSGVCSTSGEKRTSKHGISMVLKLVSIEYQKMGAFQAAL